jgi:hypothetical protein
VENNVQSLRRSVVRSEGPEIPLVGELGELALPLGHELLRDMTPLQGGLVGAAPSLMLFRVISLVVVKIMLLVLIDNTDGERVRLLFLFILVKLIGEFLLLVEERHKYLLLHTRVHLMVIDSPAFAGHSLVLLLSPLTLAASVPVG